MPKDWYEWHDLYNTEPKLQQRLEIVQEYIAYSLNASPDGAIRIVSVCAGDGRDLLGTLKNHPRAKDVYARFVELSPQLVERGRATIESLGLAKQIEIITRINAWFDALNQRPAYHRVKSNITNNLLLRRRWGVEPIGNPLPLGVADSEKIQYRAEAAETLSDNPEVTIARKGNC